MRLQTAAILAAATAPLLTGLSPATEAQAQTPATPNIVLINADDLGYGDIRSYWSETELSQAWRNVPTPNIDALGANGAKLTDYYTTYSVCSPSRAALLTGRFSWRVGLNAAIQGSSGGMNTGEITLAQALNNNTADYASIAIGKWHLGEGSQYLPTVRGFDSFFGHQRAEDNSYKDSNGRVYLPIHNSNVGANGQVTTSVYDFLREQGSTEAPSTLAQAANPADPTDKAVTTSAYRNQGVITPLYTQRAIDFMDSSLAASKSFMVYLPHAMPHVPLATANLGSDGKLDYGDVIRDLDASVGAIVQAVKDRGIENNTVIIFTSDNGPWLKKGGQGGSAGPLNGGKADPLEGGTRVPFMISWSGQIAGGQVIDTPASNVDIFRTLAQLGGAQIEAKNSNGKVQFTINGQPVRTDKNGNGLIDGQNILPMLTGGSVTSRPIYYDTDAVRVGDWKFIPANSGTTANTWPDQLYNLRLDMGEKTNLAGDPRYAHIQQALAARIAPLKSGATENTDVSMPLAMNESLRIDFGQSNKETASNWNNRSSSLALAGASSSTPMLKNLIRSQDGLLTSSELYLKTTSNATLAFESGGLGNTISGVPHSVTEDGISIQAGGGGAGQVVFQISDLDPTLVYTLKLFTKANTTWSSGGAGAVVDGSTATLTGLQTDAFGVLSFSASVPSGQTGLVSGLQLQAVPEPGSAALLLLTATALRRRRR